MTNVKPDHIAISKSKGIEIDWNDGHRSSFGIQYLRLECPCANCAGTHGTTPIKQIAKTQDLFPMYKPALKIDQVEPVGAYAIRLYFNDGHNTGIYSFSYLREVCPCAACSARRLVLSEA
jgi:DUF971 family protein